MPRRLAAPCLKRRAVAWLLSILFLLLWLLWVASAVRLMWLLVVLVALPWAIRGAASGRRPSAAPAGQRRSGCRSCPRC